MIRRTITINSLEKNRDQLVDVRIAVVDATRAGDLENDLLVIEFKALRLSAVNGLEVEISQSVFSNDSSSCALDVHVSASGFKQIDVGDYITTQSYLLTEAENNRIELVKVT